MELGREGFSQGNGNGRMGRQEALVHDLLGEGQSRVRVVLP